MNANNHPRVGVGIIVIRGNQVLLGKRLNSHGQQSWSFPGGHLEYGENILDCATREAKEETGLTIAKPHIATLTNDIFIPEAKHYITIHIISHSTSGEPIVMEPTKCQSWQWFSWDNLPSPLFLPLQNLIKQKFNPFQQDNH